MMPSILVFNVASPPGGGIREPQRQEGTNGEVLEMTKERAESVSG